MLLRITFSSTLNLAPLPTGTTPAMWLTSEDFIIGLLEGLQEEVGDASAAIMYTVGLEWGKYDSLIFEGWFEKRIRHEPPPV